MTVDQHTAHKKLFSSELALCIGILLNGLCVTLMVHSNLGISTLSGIPLAIFELADRFSFGTWNFIVQAFIMTILVVVTRSFKIDYILSFVLARIFGWLLDMCAIPVSYLAYNWPVRILCFLAGLFGISFGISLFYHCTLPLLPFDIFVRDLSRHIQKPTSAVRLILDLTAVSIVLGISFILGRIVGIGVGTIICAFLTSPLIQIYSRYLDKHFFFLPVIPALKRTCHKPDAPDRQVLREKG